MPLSIEKSTIIHCGQHQPKFAYVLNGQRMPCVESFRDLGVIRTTDSSYSLHCHQTANKAAMTSNAIRRIFSSGARELLWPAFQYYVIPSLMYCSPSWNPCLKTDSNKLERVQRRFTKSIAGLHELSYDERLQSLGALSLHNLRKRTDMLTVYKILHGHINCSPKSLGLLVTSSTTRSGHSRLVRQRAVSRIHGSLFPIRAPSMWNKLPIDIINCKTFGQFKNCLSRFLESS